MDDLIAGPSEHIGVYRVEQHLGTGGMGEVYRGFDDRLARPVAIKRIRHDAQQTPERRERFRREAQAAARLNHPAVVQVYDVVFGESSDAIVMELVEGATLAELLVEEAVDGATALDLARQVASGLAAAHAEGILHRDLKTENVMVTASRQAKILDFGLAKPLTTGEASTLTEDGAVLGTSRAMSPEQVQGHELGHGSDLFSFGVLCYEMFTGYSPFRGGSIFETLMNVTARHPPPARALRPELPQELSSLIEALLEKDPARRPQSADQVSRSLEQIATLPEISALRAATVAPGAAGGAPTPSNAPTGSLTIADVTAQNRGQAPREQAMPEQAMPITSRRRPGIAAGTVLVLGWVLGLTLALGLLYFLAQRPPAEISVLVLRPKIVSGADDEKIKLIAAGVKAASLSTLVSLGGVSPIEPHGETPRSPLEAAHAEAADEVLSTEIHGDGGLCRIFLRRIEAKSGKILASESLEISSLPQHARDLADRLGSKLRGAFAEYPPPPGDPDLEVSADDYAAFIKLRERSDSGQPSNPEDVERLAAILENSPQFLEGYVYAAYVAFVRGDLERADAFTRTAIELAPNDPRPLVSRLRSEVDSGRFDEAESTLTRLEQLVPGDLMVLRSRARLLKQLGELEQALELQSQVVELRPSWQHLYHLANIEVRLGKIDDARHHIEVLFERSPQNRYGLTLLGRLELFYGDLERAAEIYLDLIEIDPDNAQTNLTSLGLIRYLLGHYAEAIASYRQALELDSPRLSADLLLRINLANALLAVGAEGEARALYQEILTQLEAKLSGSELSANESMIQAECLARLGRFEPAVEATQNALQLHPEDSEVAYLAALVYAVLGDRNHTLLYARRALDKDVQPRWFRIPAFAELLGEADLEDLLRQHRQTAE